MDKFFFINGFPPHTQCAVFATTVCAQQQEKDMYTTVYIHVPSDSTNNNRILLITPRVGF